VQFLRPPSLALALSKQLDSRVISPLGETMSDQHFCDFNIFWA